MMPQDLQIFLDKLMSRSVLSEEEQQAVLDLPGHAAQVPGNRDVVRHGEVVDHACFVADGLVGQFDQTRKGERQITALKIPGDMANLHSAVLPKATFALQALSTSTILRVPQVAVRAAMRRYPALAEAIWRDCMVDAAVLSQWVINVGRRDARSRMAHLLCEMATRYKGTIDTNEVTFNFSLSQAHLADATGLTNVHVNRTLRMLREAGLVTLGSGRATILDWKGLTTLGDFDPVYLQIDLRSDERLRILEVV